MADDVQYRMEKMVAELDDHERRGIFTKEEIAEIVRMRLKFEYRRKRPSPRKSDLLDYIDYEKRVESLRILRKKKASAALKAKGGKRMKVSISDYAGVRRIIDLFSDLTFRFKGDLSIWFQYLEFCKVRKNGRLKKALARALKLHSKIPAMWIYAASWEFDHNLNAQAAGAIMLEGLRACPTSEDLWVEYLRMELTYLNKLMAHKAELGENVGTLSRNGAATAEGQDRKDEQNEEFVSLGKEQGEDAESEKTPNFYQEKGYNILRTVYKGSIAALPSSLSLRKKFLEILEATDLAHSEQMRKEILADMKNDFSKDPEYWDWLATLTCSELDIDSESVRCQVNKALEVYEEAASVVPSEAMFDLYVKFLTRVITSNRTTASEHVEKYISCLERVFEQAENAGALTKDLARQHISFLLETGDAHRAQELLKKYTQGKFSDSVEIWILRISMEMEWLTDPVGAFRLLTKFLKRTSISDAESLWLMALNDHASSENYIDTLLEISIDRLTRDGGSEDGFSLSTAFVKFYHENFGIRAARKLYKRYLALPRPGLVFYKFCIELETSLALDGDKQSLGNARKLFESALDTYKQDVSIWRAYHSLEIKMGTSETANGVYWRAQKTLGDAVSLLMSSV